MSLPNHFELLATDGQARTGRLTTPHGVVRTPAFMPVGTAGAMKGMHWREVRDAAPLDAPASGSPLAEGHAGSMRLGRRAH